MKIKISLAVLFIALYASNSICMNKKTVAETCPTGSIATVGAQAAQASNENYSPKDITRLYKDLSDTLFEENPHAATVLGLITMIGTEIGKAGSNQALMALHHQYARIFDAGIKYLNKEVVAGKRKLSKIGTLSVANIGLELSKPNPNVQKLQEHRENALEAWRGLKAIDETIQPSFENNMRLYISKINQLTN